MNDDPNDATGRRTSEEPEGPGLIGSMLDPSELELEDDELGVPASTAVGGLVPEGATDDRP